MSAATDPRWLEDPSPSWDECARRAGTTDFRSVEDTPDDPSGGINQITAKLWPRVHPLDQEKREHSQTRGLRAGGEGV